MAGESQGRSRGREPGRRPSGRPSLRHGLCICLGSLVPTSGAPGSVMPEDRHMGTHPSQRWGRLCIFLELCPVLGSWAITLDTLIVVLRCPDMLSILQWRPDTLSVCWQCPAEASAARVQRRKREGRQSPHTGCFHPYSRLCTAEHVKPRVP